MNTADGTAPAPARRVAIKMPALKCPFSLRWTPPPPGRPADLLFHLVARPEPHGDPFGHGHLLAGAGVAGGPRPALLDLEDAEVAQLDAALGRQGLDDAVEQHLDDLLGDLLPQARFVG